jgi:D-arabinose 5-phosphate isomerase GutQ
MNTMIILQGISNSGKTTTLRNLAKLLTTNNSKFELINGNLEEGDFIIKIEVNNKIIVIVSMGDNDDLKNKLELVYNKYTQIDILFGASRTKGETVKIINQISVVKNANIIWTSTYKNNKESKILNNIKAKELLNLIDELNLI